MRSHRVTGLGLAFALALVGPSMVRAAERPGLRAGAAMSNLTPPLGLSLASVIGSQGGVARHVHDELWARCSRPL